jgi:TRAP-type C4-dicarboxylate transport system permease small subunit
MSDLMKKETRGKLALGAGGIAGGVGILVVSGIVASSWPVALVVGGLVLWGSWKLFQKPHSALVGMVGLAAGILVAATAVPLVGHLASLLLTLSGVGLAAGGVWAIVQVFKARRR